MDQGILQFRFLFATVHPCLLEVALRVENRRCAEREPEQCLHAIGDALSRTTPWRGSRKRKVSASNGCSLTFETLRSGRWIVQCC